MKDRVLTLVAVMPGRIRDGLEAMLASMPQIEVLEEAEDGPSALRLATHAQPALVLLDADLLNGEDWGILHAIKIRCPQTQWLLLTNTSRQMQIARSNGADDVLFKGFSMIELSQAIYRLREVYGKNQRMTSQRI